MHRSTIILQILIPVVCNTTVSTKISLQLPETLQTYNHCGRTLYLLSGHFHLRARFHLNSKHAQGPVILTRKFKLLRYKTQL